MSENYFWSSVKRNLIIPLRLRKHGICFSLNYGNIVSISLELELNISELNMILNFLFISWTRNPLFERFCVSLKENQTLIIMY